MFGDQRCTSRRGLGEVEAVSGDNLSQEKAISSRVSQPVQEMRSDREIFPPLFITASAQRSLAPSFSLSFSLSSSPSTSPARILLSCL